MQLLLIRFNNTTRISKEDQISRVRQHYRRATCSRPLHWITFVTFSRDDFLTPNTYIAMHQLTMPSTYHHLLEKSMGCHEHNIKWRHYVCHFKSASKEKYHYFPVETKRSKTKHALVTIVILEPKEQNYIIIITTSKCQLQELCFSHS